MTDLFDTAIPMLKRHEGFRHRAYKDSLGVWTIGYGTNLQELEVPETLAAQWLIEKYGVAVEDARWFATEQVWNALTVNRKAVLVDMAYNLGRGNLAEFKNTRTKLQAHDYIGVADNMLQSKWAKQVGDRAIELAEMMEAG